MNIISQFTYAWIENLNNKSQSRYKHPKHTKVFTKRKTQNSLEPIGPNDPLTKIVAIVQITYKPS